MHLWKVCFWKFLLIFLSKIDNIILYCREVQKTIKLNFHRLEWWQQTFKVCNDVVFFMPFNVLILYQGELDVAKWLWKSYFCGKGHLDCLWQSGLKIVCVFLHYCTACIFSSCYGSKELWMYKITGLVMGWSLILLNRTLMRLCITPPRLRQWLQWL